MVNNTKHGQNEPLGKGTKKENLSYKSTCMTTTYFFRCIGFINKLLPVIIELHCTKLSNYIYSQIQNVDLHTEIHEAFCTKIAKGKQE